MTSLPMPPGLSETTPALAATGAGDSCGLERRGTGHGSNHSIEDEQQLLRAFRTFAETSGSLERFYGLLRAEVAQLRRELEESHSGLARSVEENRSMREHLDRILESLPCGVAVVSSAGEIMRLNPEGRRLLGVAQDVMQDASQDKQGQPALQLLANLRSELRELLQAGEMGEAERQVLTPPEPARWLSVRQAALPESGGGASVFILQDISERKRLEQEQHKHRREQALAEMSAVLAHEIRNPLGSLELFAGLLAEAELGPECREWIGHLQHGLRTLATTVNNVLHFHGAPSPERAPVDLGQLLDWAASFLAPLARRSYVELLLRNGLRGVLFAGDRHQLEQVLLNLSLNALRVMPEGGRLELSGETSYDPSNGLPFATLCISDTGPGIPPENLAEIFKAGFSTRAGSPGLGLAVCSKIVQQHGGTIAGEIRAETGAAFTVRFSLAENSLECARPQPLQPHPSENVMNKNVMNKKKNVMNQVAS
ncbi:MAG TPA: ATP-binding protein [Candidatus Sulfotelmatobacter sp.]